MELYTTLSYDKKKSHSFRALVDTDSPFAYLNLRHMAISDEAGRLVESIISDIATVPGSKRPRREHIEACAALLADLLHVATLGATAYGYRSLGRDTFTDAEVGYKAFKTVTDGMVARGLLGRIKALKVLPLPGDDIASATTFRPTPALISYVAAGGIEPAEWNLHFEPRPRRRRIRNPIVLKAEAQARSKYRRAKLPGRRMKVNRSRPMVLHYERQVHEINEFMVDRVIEPNKHNFFYRVFNQGNLPGVDYNKGGRLISAGASYQNMEREERLAIRIDGEPTVEIDIGASHLTIVHALLGVPLDTSLDPYDRLAGLPREVAKLWVTMTLGLGHLHKKWPDDIKLSYNCPHRVAWKKLPKPRPKREVCRCLQEDYPIGVSNKLMMTAFPLFDEWFVSGYDWGDLQFIESRVIIDAMTELNYDHDICVLPVHDSLIVPQVHQGLAERKMTSNFERHVGLVPRLTVKGGGAT